MASGLSAIGLQRETILEELAKTLKKAIEIGITREELEKLIHENYAEGGTQA